MHSSHLIYRVFLLVFCCHLVLLCNDLFMYVSHKHLGRHHNIFMCSLGSYLQFYIHQESPSNVNKFKFFRFKNWWCQISICIELPEQLWCRIIPSHKRNSSFHFKLNSTNSRMCLEKPVLLLFLNSVLTVMYHVPLFLATYGQLGGCHWNS